MQNKKKERKIYFFGESNAAVIKIQHCFCKQAFVNKDNGVAVFEGSPIRSNGAYK